MKKKLEINKSTIIFENLRYVYFLIGKKVFRGNKAIGSGGRSGVRFSTFPENRKMFVLKDSVERVTKISASCRNAEDLIPYGVKVVRYQ